jgi:two-component system chemotaxis sensor kinase CheA
MQPPKDIFCMEADELLDIIEQSILDIETGKLIPDAINNIFRAFHTIKGSAAMLGFQEISNFSHEVESLLEMARRGEIKSEVLKNDFTQIILSSKDHLRECLQCIKSDQKITIDCVLLVEIDKLKNDNVKNQHDTVSEKESSNCYYIELKPNKDIVKIGLDPVSVLKDLSKMGKCDVKVNTNSVPGLGDLNAIDLYIIWGITIQTPNDIDTVKQAFIFYEGMGAYDVKEANNTFNANCEISDTGKPLQEDDTSVRGVIEEKALGASNKKVVDVKVSSLRLDTLVNLVGELVVNYTQLYKNIIKSKDVETCIVLEEHNRIIESLKESVLEIRMVPVSVVFNRFRRVIRDLNKELNKNVELLIEGEDTELDKTIVDKLYDPLLHLVRNSMDHGIEDNQNRKISDKSPNGKITLKAINEGSQIKIIIKDDGVGINYQYIRNNALKLGLIDQNSKLTNDELSDLIFKPGFSTKENLTQISGRGMGMSVVKEEIHDLRGTIALNSDHNRGTVITIRLPLTLSIIEGLLTVVDQRKYIFPMSSVRENINYSNSLEYNNKWELLDIRGDLIPHISLREIFKAKQLRNKDSQIVVVRIGNEKFGIEVDKIIGPYQTVIQPFNGLLKGINVFSGASIMGDGGVSLIINLMGILEYTQLKKYE